VVAEEVAAQKFFGLDVAGAGGPARADGDELAGVVEGVCAIKALLRGSGECRRE